MSSWSVKLALDGFTFSLVEARVGFAPKLSADDYRTFWSTGAGWGRYTQTPGEGVFVLEVLHGSQILKRLDLADMDSDGVKVIGPSGEVPAILEGKSVILRAPVTLRAGEKLKICAAARPNL
jgi:hypothetical protein